MNKIFISYISGGIDSLFSLILLKMLKYKLKGFYMLNWVNFKNTNILNILKIISIKFNLEIIYLNIKNFYLKKIFFKFLKNLKKFNFINIDSECNKKIKFNLILNYFLKKKYPKICTGHYSKLVLNKLKSKNILIKNCVDYIKNQNYFLQLVKLKKLKKCLFVLNKIYKLSINFFFNLNFKNLNLKGKSSKGICFFENNNMILFIKNYILKNIKIDNNSNRFKKIKIIILKIFKKKKSIFKKLKYFKYNFSNSKNYYICKVNITSNLLFLNFINYINLYKGNILYLYYKNIFFRSFKF